VKRFDSLPGAHHVSRHMTPARAAFAGIFLVTLLGMLSIGATLPVLPRYVKGPLGAGDLEVGIVTGAFAVTGLACRPIAGRFADARGRRPAVLIGAALSTIAAALYFVPAGVPNLVVARLFLGAGEGLIYTAGSAWVVDLAPPERRGQIIGWYGLAIWGGLSVGPAVGELVLQAWGYHAVWAFALAAPLLGAVIALRIPESFRPREEHEPGGPLIAREALRPGLAFSCGTVGFAAVSGFIVLMLEARGIENGTLAFIAFAATVVGVRLVGGNLPDRFGGARCAAVAGLVEAAGLALMAVAQSLTIAVVGALLMGGAFALLLPALALIALEEVPIERRGATMGTLTAFFDLGVGVGAPLAGLVAGLAGYGAAFWVAAAFALGLAVLAARAGPGRAAPAPAPG
jgi:MFS family permease